MEPGLRFGEGSRPLAELEPEARLQALLGALQGARLQALCGCLSGVALGFALRTWGYPPPLPAGLLVGAAALLPLLLSAIGTLQPTSPALRLASGALQGAGSGLLLGLLLRSMRMEGEWGHQVSVSAVVQLLGYAGLLLRPRSGLQARLPTHLPAILALGAATWLDPLRMGDGDSLALLVGWNLLVLEGLHRRLQHVAEHLRSNELVPAADLLHSAPFAFLLAIPGLILKAIPARWRAPGAGSG